jgi:hypothetical protein
MQVFHKYYISQDLVQEKWFFKNKVMSGIPTGYVAVGDDVDEYRPEFPGFLGVVGPTEGPASLPSKAELERLCRSDPNAVQFLAGVVVSTGRPHENDLVMRAAVSLHEFYLMIEKWSLILGNFY